MTIALHFLSIEAGIRVTANQFGFSVAAACQSTMQFIDVIMYNPSEFIKLRRDLEAVSAEFEQIAGVPDVVGEVDGSHVLLNRPEVWIGI